MKHFLFEFVYIMKHPNKNNILRTLMALKSHAALVSRNMSL